MISYGRTWWDEFETRILCFQARRASCLERNGRGAISKLLRANLRGIPGTRDHIYVPARESITYIPGYDARGVYVCMSRLHSSTRIWRKDRTLKNSIIIINGGTWYLVLVRANKGLTRSSGNARERESAKKTR